MEKNYVEALFLTLLLCLPLAAVGQDNATTSQTVQNNHLASLQAGANTALTLQVGKSNNSSIKQSGRNNVATVVQIGENHVRSVNQAGNDQGYGSVQVTNQSYTRSFSGTGGNGFTSTTLDIEDVN